MDQDSDIKMIKKEMNIRLKDKHKYIYVPIKLRSNNGYKGNTIMCIYLYHVDTVQLSKVGTEWRDYLKGRLNSLIESQIIN